MTRWRQRGVLGALIVLMTWELDIQRATPPAAAPATSVTERRVTWVTHLEAVDAALSRGDARAAERAWRDAHAAAVRTRAWRPLVAIGDAALRIGKAAGQRQAAASRARDAYLAALNRARAGRSADGVLHVAESFHGLGDDTVAEQCLIIAERLGASPDNETMGRLRALGHRAHDVRATPSTEP